MCVFLDYGFQFWCVDYFGHGVIGVFICVAFQYNVFVDVLCGERVRGVDFRGLDFQCHCGGCHAGQFVFSYRLCVFGLV